MSAQQQARAGRAWRLLGVLALLLGLLALHGLVSGHHAPLTPGATVLGSAGHASAGHASAGHASAAHASAAHAGATALAELLHDLGCTGCPHHTGAVLCLAVLSAGLALLALLLARHARTRSLPAPPERLPLLRDGPPLHLRPPDLVRQLCVSRT